MSHHQYMCWTLLTGTLLVGCGTEVPDGPAPRPDPDAGLDRITAGVIGPRPSRCSKQIKIPFAEEYGMLA